MFTTGVFIANFSLRRSPQHVVTTEAGNNNVDTVDIKLINRWRKRDAERGKEADIYMRQVYTQVSIAVVASLRFYKSHYVIRGG